MDSQARRRSRRGALLVISSLLFTGCASLMAPSSNQRPRFTQRLPLPVTVQVIDQRPGEEYGAERNTQWLWYSEAPELHSQLLGEYLGNGLNMMGAVPGYRLIPADAEGLEKAAYGIRLFYEHGYARWPVNTSRNQTQVMVQGRCAVRVELWSRETLIRQYREDVTPKDLPVPLGIIRRDNVNKVVGDALIHQFDKATTAMLDELLPQMALDWEAFLLGQPRVEKRPASRGVR